MNVATEIVNIGAGDDTIDNSDGTTTTTSTSVAESTSNPTTPSPSTTKPSSQAPVGGASISIVDVEMMYYPHWETGKCIEQDSSTMKRWDTGYATQDQCCQANFGWKGDKECTGTDVTNVVSSTPAPSVQSDPVDDAAASGSNANDI